jgi:hypothetical protein
MLQKIVAGGAREVPLDGREIRRTRHGGGVKLRSSPGFRGKPRRVTHQHAKNQRREAGNAYQHGSNE